MRHLIKQKWKISQYSSAVDIRAAIGGMFAKVTKIYFALWGDRSMILGCSVHGQGADILHLYHLNPEYL